MNKLDFFLFRAVVTTIYLPQLMFLFYVPFLIPMWWMQQQLQLLPLCIW